MYSGTICDIPGILVGHAQDFDAKTGVTAILCPKGAAGGVDVRGAAPGTRETDLLRCGAMVREVHAILLCGGSAFGLAAADGAMRFLSERQIGLAVGNIKVPLVPAAVLFDLFCGRSDVRPDAGMGYRACESALNTFLQGSVGAGTGATVGKTVPGAMPGKGGVGSASITLPGGIIVAAVAAVNALGDVYHPHTGALIASGTVNGKPVSFKNLLEYGGQAAENPFQNTTIGVAATNAKLSKEQANRLALTAHDGIARTIFPAHTEMDGDTIFALAAGEITEGFDMISLCAAASEAFARAIVNAVEAAQ